MENQGKGGKAKEALITVVVVVVLVLLYAWRRQRTVKRLFAVFQEDPWKGVLILVGAIVLAVVVVGIRKRVQKRKGE